MQTAGRETVPLRHLLVGRNIAHEPFRVPERADRPPPLPETKQRFREDEVPERPLRIGVDTATERSDCVLRTAVFNG